VTGPEQIGIASGDLVVVAGLGVSGLAVARTLLVRDIRVLVVDERSDDSVAAAADEVRGRGGQVRLGDARTPVSAGLVVTSPGWRPEHPLLAAAAADGIEVIGEPELAWRLRAPDAPDWIGVTGTNGKTTTVGMLATILDAAGLRTVAAGNIGTPLVEAVEADNAYDVIAVELSSFQLHWTSSMQVAAATILNIADDHTDWHGSAEAYRADKQRILRGDPVTVVNLDDPGSVEASRPATVTVGFTLAEPEPGRLGVRNGSLIGSAGEVLAEAGDLSAPGPHNIANALAASALARVRGIDPERVRAGLRAYSPGRHRNELVASAGGVDWVDDSKATNPHAAAASLSGYDHVVWIAGGLLKGASVDELVVAHGGRLRAAVLIGRDRAVIGAALARHAPDVPVVTIGTKDTGGMDEAVEAAADLAVAGDTVLLAPAAASMDMFRDYAERGDRFAAAARRVTRGR
jgi:UDP-N-acetylmuramoylalanine--D-glutamate ligase